MAARTADMVEKGLGGLFHMGGGRAHLLVFLRRADLRTCGRSPSLTPDQRKRVPDCRAPPKFSALSNSKLEAAGITPMPPLRVAIGDYLKRRQTLLTIVLRSVVAGREPAPGLPADRP